MHFLGIKWDNETKRPFLRVRASPGLGEEERLALEVGSNLTLRVGQARYCVTCHNHPDYLVDALKYPGVLADANKALCNICLRKNRVFFMPLTALDSAEKDLLEERPHFNYLNVFGSELLKTGVVSAHKQFSRVLEQGAVATLFFARSDGVVARQLESFVSKEFKIAQAVRWDSKLKLLLAQTNGSASETEKLLETVLAQVRQRVPAELIPYLLSSDEFSYNWPHYQLALPRSLNSLQYVTQLGPGDVITGNLIGTYGQILLLENDYTYYAFNTNSLLGYLFEFENEAANAGVQVAISPRKLTLKAGEKFRLN